MDKAKIINLCLIGIVIVYVSLCGIGIFALNNSPILVDGNNRVLHFNADSPIEKVAALEIDADLFIKVPEFTSKQRERSWHDMHGRLYRLLSSHSTVSVKAGRMSGNYQVTTFDFFAALKKLLPLLIITGALFACSAYLLFQPSSEATYVLAIATLFAAIYYLSSGILSSSFLTLPPIQLNLFVYFSYLGSAGFIALVHFAYIFPRQKLNQKWKKYLLCTIYGYTSLVIILYFIDVIAFGAAIPMVILWTFVLIGGFLHSVVREAHNEIKRQLLIVLVLPIISALIFTFLNVLAAYFNQSPFPHAEQALFALTVVLVLIISIDKVELHKRIEHLTEDESSNPIVKEVAQKLTAREFEITMFFIQGKKANEIAQELPITYSTVRTHVRSIYQKLGVKSEVELVAMATGTLKK